MICARRPSNDFIYKHIKLTVIRTAVLEGRDLGAIHSARRAALAWLPQVLQTAFAETFYFFSLFT